MVKKVLILIEYLEFADVFLNELATEFLKRFNINKHSIYLKSGKQPPYGLIYSSSPVKLEILKIFIKINLINRFIQPSKSPAEVSIFFI